MLPLFSEVCNHMNETVFLIIALAALALLIAILIKNAGKTNTEAALRQELMSQFQALSGMLADMLRQSAEASSTGMGTINSNVERRLAHIERVVDEKLSHTLKSGLDSSFARVGQQLKSVNESMGEVRALTGDIGDLKNILSNVKTRGIFGEAQLLSLLEDFLAPGQFSQNAHIGESGIVEFAIRLPRENGNHTLLPIDSKFPMDKFLRVVKYAEEGNAEKLLASRKEFVATVLTEAKKISEKYIRPPITTDYAIMYLPSESLYLEVVKLDMPGRLQRDYKVMVAGPASLYALITSLKAGFRAFEVNRHSKAILDMLVSVHSEFEGLSKAAGKANSALKSAGSHLGSLSTRLEKVQSKLGSMHITDEQDFS